MNLLFQTPGNFQFVASSAEQVFQTLADRDGTCGFSCPWDLAHQIDQDIETLTPCYFPTERAYCWDGESGVLLIRRTPVPHQTAAG